MRIVRNLFFLLFFSNVSGQSQKGIRETAGQNGADSLLNAYGFLPETSSVFVIDGQLVELQKLREIDPQEIESVNVLKNNSFGCHRSNGALLITTKRYGNPKISVIDSLSGERLANATVVFRNAKHVVMATADGNGLVVTGQLGREDVYEMTITMTGYKKQVSVFKNQKNAVYEIALERDLKECQPVVVNGYGYDRVCGGLRCLVQRSVCTTYAGGTNILPEEPVTVYPNPVPRGGNVTVEIKDGSFMPVQVKLVSLAGQPLLVRSQSEIKNGRRFMFQAGAQWSSGIYIVQLLDKKGKPVQSARLLVQ